MLPVYNPKAFDGVDLRKYHISSIKDAIKFLDFTMSRMEEALFVLKKFNTQFATFQTVSQQLQKQLQKQQETYGAGAHNDANKAEPGVIQSVEEPKPEDTDLGERKALLDEMRQAIADETLVPAEEDEDPDARLQVEYERYKAVKGKRNRIFYYRTNEEGKTQMVSDKDVPNDIKEIIMKELDEKADKEA